MATQFKVFASVGPTRATGGVAIILHKSLIGPDDITEDKAAVPGRVLRVCIIGPQRVRVFWSIHNHVLTKEQRKSIGRQLTEDFDKHNERMLAVVWVGGD